jgi:hypothetical protein
MIIKQKWGFFVERKGKPLVFRRKTALRPNEV